MRSYCQHYTRWRRTFISLPLMKTYLMTSAFSQIHLDGHYLHWELTRKKFQRIPSVFTAKICQFHLAKMAEISVLGRKKRGSGTVETAH